MLKAISNFVILKECPPKRKSKIVLLTEPKKLYTVAVVVAVGSKVQDDIAVGNYVLIPAGAGVTISNRAIEYLSVREPVIFAIADEETAKVLLES